jgi:hypothetical protein
MSVGKFSLHVETSEVLGLIEIYVLQRFKPDVLQISNVGGQTSSLNLLHVREVWLYGYDI